MAPKTEKFSDWWIGNFKSQSEICSKIYSDRFQEKNLKLLDLFIKKVFGLNKYVEPLIKIGCSTLIKGTLIKSRVHLNLLILCKHHKPL